MRFAAEAHAAVAAAPRLDVGLRPVVKHDREVRAPGWGRPLLAVDDRDHPAAAAGAERDHAFAGGEDRVVAPEPGAVAGPEPRAALAHDDLAAPDPLPGEHLHAEHLRVRVTAVAARSKSLLVRHQLSFLADVDLEAGFLRVV